MTPKEVLALCRQKEIRAVDLRFMDFPGTHKHFTIPVKALTEKTFEDGLTFGASSMYGWQAINESDMLVLPQAETAMVDPFMQATLALTCNIQDPITREDYAKDPRNVARKAQLYMQSTGIADTANFGAEAEFFVFDSVRFDLNEHEAYYHLDSSEGQWNRAAPTRPLPLTVPSTPATVCHREGISPSPSRHPPGPH
jgi:glutamine synthetase